MAPKTQDFDLTIREQDKDLQFAITELPMEIVVDECYHEVFDSCLGRDLDSACCHVLVMYNDIHKLHRPQQPFY